MTRDQTIGGAPDGGAAGRERAGVIGLAALIVLTVAGYLAVKSSVLESEGTAQLLPFQALVRTLPSADQAMFAEMQRQVLEAERIRAASGLWPEAATLGQTRGSTTAPGAEASHSWTRAREGFFLHYLAKPSDAAAPAWLASIQEPDPQAPPDRAPNDETHHRLPDGTVLHVTIWTHRFGGQVAPGFVRQPETAGWTQVLTAPVVPWPPAGS